MAYTLPQLIVEARATLNEAAASFFSDAEITQWLNQGALIVSSMSRCVEVVQAITLVINQPAYFLAANTIGVDSAFIRGLALTKLRSRQIGHVHGDNEEYPSHFAYFAGAIRFFGTPQTSTTVTLNSWMRSSDPTLITDHFQLLVIDYAAIRAKIKDRKMQEAAQLYAIFARSMQFMRNDLIDYVPDSKESQQLADRIQVSQNG